MTSPTLPTLRERLRSIPIAEVMQSDVLTAPADASARELAGLMADRGVHAVVLTRPGGPPTALTSLGVVQAAVAGRDGPALDAVGVEAPPAARPDEPLRSALARMVERRASHLLVLREDGTEPAGVLSCLDVAPVVAGDEELGPIPPRPRREAPPPNATVGQAMNVGLVAVSPDARLPDLARALVEHRVHALIVAGHSAQALGAAPAWTVVTDFDVAKGAYMEPDATASELGSTAPPTIGEEEPLERAAAIMASQFVRHVVVVRRSGLPVGVVSTLDVLRALATEA